MAMSDVKDSRHLRLYSKFCKWQWNLQPYELGDDFKKLLAKNEAFNDNAKALDVVSWAIEAKTQSQQPLQLPAVDACASEEQGDESDDNVSAELAEQVPLCINSWLENATTSRQPFTDCFGTVLRYIRDAIFLNIRKRIQSKEFHRGVYGFCITSFDSVELYYACLEFCKCAFWFQGQGENLNGDYSIYPINAADYTSDTKGLMLWYSNSASAQCCCCQVCNSVYCYIGKGTDSAIVELIRTSPFKLLDFLKHNRCNKILEHQLLCVTLEAYFMLQQQEKFCANNNVKDALNYSGCFVILRDFDMGCRDYFEDLTASDVLLNLPSLILDLVHEYTLIWQQLDLQIFLFCLSTIEQTQQEKLPDGTANKLLYTYDHTTIVELVPYVGHVFHVHKRLVNDVNLKAKWLGENIGKDIDCDIDKILTLVDGYKFDHLPTLVRIAKCEALKRANCIDEFSKHFNIECFFRAISLKKPSHLLTCVPSSCHVIYPDCQGGGRVHLGVLAPLEADGSRRQRRGFDAMILTKQQLEWLNDFLEEKVYLHENVGHTLVPLLVLQGPSGSGKTSLGIALAYEMSCVLVIANILDFICPQVGQAEVQIYEFFTNIKSQFYAGCTSIGSRKSATKCLVLLEGLESLGSDENDGGRCPHHARRLIARICTEIDDIISKAHWEGCTSIMLVCPVTSVFCLPKRLKSRFSKAPTFELFSEIKNVEEFNRCIELYSAGRGIDLEMCSEVSELRTRSLVKIPSYAEVATCCHRALVAAVKSIE